MPANVARVYLSLHREEGSKLIRSYGLAIIYDGEYYAIASVYLDDPLKKSDAIRIAIGHAVNLKREGTEIVVVYSRETEFKYVKNQYRFAQGIITTKVSLQYLPPNAGTRGAWELSQDAYRRKSTIEEILGGMENERYS